MDGLNTAPLPACQAPLPPTTTVQQDLVTHGQRRINIIWEVTQSIIAIAVVIANLLVGVHIGMNGSAQAAPPVLSNSLFLVIGFYFSRTNHETIGGIGVKRTSDYQGR
jgi:hypothetical protein